MNPRDSRLGAVPETAIAVLDSDVHHIREQADADRRQEAAFRAETRRTLEQITASQASTSGQMMRVTDLINRLDVSTAANAGTLTAVCTELSEQRGALKIVAALAVVVMPLVMEALRHVFR